MSQIMLDTKPMLEAWVEKSIQTITPKSEDGKFVTEAEYWANYYSDLDFNYEWNNGYLEEKPVSNLINYSMYKWFIFILEHFLQVHPIATTIGLEMGFRLPMKGKTSIRKPDLGVVLHTNPVPMQPNDHTYKGIFDLCIESLSDSRKKEKERDMITKYAEYAAVGVKEYFILYASGTGIGFYRFNSQLGIYEEIKPVDGIIRSTILSGFQFRLDDLFTQPSYAQLANDPIYQGYIGLEYQQEKQRAEQEQAKAARYAQKLRELGLSPDEL